MKIAICVSNDIVFDQRMARIASSLSKVGHDVTLIGRKLKSTPPISNLSYSTKQLICFINSGPLFYFELNIRLFLFLLFNQFDLIYACDPDTIPASATIKKIKSLKGVYDSHELFVETPEIHNRPFIKLIWSKIESFFGSKMDTFITVNEALVEELSKKLNKKFYPIRNLPHYVPFEKSTTMKQNILLYQGVLNEGRGLESSIMAMEFLPEYKLWIAGDGDIKYKLEKLVSTLNLQQRVEFLGKLPPKELKKITVKAKYGLNLLSGDSKNYYLSLANKFFDYMAYGVPSINMNFPLYSKYCDKYKCGITISDLNPSNIAGAIKNLDQIDYKTLSTNSLNSHKILNWENEEQKLWSIII